MSPLKHASKFRGFTLIELLIVVAIIAILAAIAVPNFLEAQVRAKTSRAKADMRNMATAIESYRIDNGSYPEGTDNPNKYPEQIQEFLGPLGPGFYTFRSRTTDGRSVGEAFAGITTPVAYINSIPADPFAEHAAAFLTYAYRNAKDVDNGWILTSVGPDTDLLDAKGIGTKNVTNQLSTATDPKGTGGGVARIGDINERAYIRIIEGGVITGTRSVGQLLEDLTYDPTNGSVSDGDIWRVGP